MRYEFLGKRIFRINLLWVGMAVWVVVSSCGKKTTTEILPDSCTGLVTINIPEIAPKLLKNRPLLDSLSSLIGLPLEDIGLNYLQPAYIFQQGPSSDRQWYFLAGLSDEKAFTIMLAERFPALEIAEQSGYRSAEVHSFLLVWSDQFIIGKWYNPMLGQKPDHAALAAILSRDEIKRVDEKSVTTDIAFAWNFSEPPPAAVLPPFELSVEGTASLDENRISVKSEVEEHVYLALLRPFQLSKPDLNREQGIRMVFWPALESILLQIQAYGGNAYQQEMNPAILGLVKLMDHPFELTMDENGPESLLENIRIKTRFTQENLAQILENEIKTMIPKSVLADYRVSRNKGEVVFHHHSVEPGFAFEYVAAEKIPNLIFGAYQRNQQTRTSLSLVSAGGGIYQFMAELENPERLAGNPLFSSARRIDSKEVIHQFLP